MHSLDLIPYRWLAREPPSLCHTGIEELAGLGAASAVAAPTAASVLGGAAETALLSSAGVATGAAAGLPAAAVTGAGIFGTGIGLSDIGAAASVGGTLLQAGAQSDEAAYEKALAKNQALALQQKANEDAAAAERQQGQQLRRMGLVLSRQRALAASSGTDANSPDVVTNELRTVGQGEYNALSSLYEGLSAARSDQYQAGIDLFKARRIGQALPYAVGGTLLSGVSNFATNRLRSRYLASSPNAFFGFGGF